MLPAEGQARLLRQQFPRRRVDASLPQRLLNERPFGIGVCVPAVRMLRSELLFQAGVFAAEPGITTQHIPERQHGSGVRMLALDYLQVMGPGLRPRPQQP